MFNKTTINQSGKSYVPYAKSVTVHEHKAPTDKSVELLNEMQVKARDNIVSTFSISNNLFNVDLAVFQNYAGFGYIVNYRYVLNGTEYKGGFPVEASSHLNKHQIIEKILEEINNSLFKVVLSDIGKVFKESYIT